MVNANATFAFTGLLHGPRTPPVDRQPPPERPQQPRKPQSKPQSNCHELPLARHVARARHFSRTSGPEHACQAGKTQSGLGVDSRRRRCHQPRREGGDATGAAEFGIPKRNLPSCVRHAGLLSGLWGARVFLPERRDRLHRQRSVAALPRAAADQPVWILDLPRQLKREREREQREGCRLLL